MTLTSERLVLRPFRIDDFDWLHPITVDPLVTLHTDWGPNEPGDTRAFLEDARANGTGPHRFTWTVTLIDGGGIGSAELSVTSPASRRASFGYMLDPKVWGRGYATEAATLLIQFARTELSLHRLEAICRPDNHGSMRVLEKAGMGLEGRLHDHVLVRGTWCDSLLFAVVLPD